MDNIYKVPLVFREEGVDDFVLEHFHTEAAEPDLAGWSDLRPARTRPSSRCGSRSWASTSASRTPTCRSSRRCATRASCTAGAWRSTGWTPRSSTRPRPAERLGEADGILIPGGFGGRGIEGKIAAARIARESGIPYLGICLGMQLAVCEFARHATGMEGANSTEFDPETPFAVIDLLPEQKEVADMGGTMRLGADPIKLHDGTRAREIYGEAVVYERHRHRYEVNNLLRKRLEAAGMVFSGTSPDDRLVEVIELPASIPFFVASQYHPEFKSRPTGRARCSASSSAPRSTRARGRRARGRARGGARARGRAVGHPRAAVTSATAPERARLNDLFAELCRIESPFGHERACSDRVAAELRDAGLEVSEDDAGPAAGAECGNLLARIGEPGEGADGASVRPPRHGRRRRRRSSPCWSRALGERREGILGADNKAAVAVLLGGRARAVRSGRRWASSCF